MEQLQDSHWNGRVVGCGCGCGQALIFLNWWVLWLWVYCWYFRLIRWDWPVSPPLRRSTSTTPIWYQRVSCQRWRREDDAESDRVGDGLRQSSDKRGGSCYILEKTRMKRAQMRKVVMMKMMRRCLSHENRCVVVMNICIFILSEQGNIWGFSFWAVSM